MASTLDAAVAADGERHATEPHRRYPAGWTLWDQTRGPVSLGVLPPGGAIRLPPERLEAIGDGQLFEITLEPEAGSPIGRPTGRILFIGRAKGAATQAL